MTIGITYDLRQDYLANGFSEEETAEFDRADTIDAIDGTLQELGHQTDRIGNIANLTKRLAAGDKWDLVFNIAEGLRGYGREAQVPALLDAYDIPYTFSDPMVLSMTLHKGMAKRIARDAGIPTPDFRIIESEADALLVDLDFPLFVKPVAEGTGKGVGPESVVSTREQLVSVSNMLCTQYRQPVLAEALLPGREFTVGILGNGRNASAIGVMEVFLNQSAEPGAYSYVNKEKCEELVEYRLATDREARKAAKVALDVWRELGGLDAGRVDLKSDARGRPNFMEANPLAGLHPEHSDLCILACKVGMTYTQLIDAIVSSAFSRCAVGRMAYAGTSNWDRSQ